MYVEFGAVLLAVTVSVVRSELFTSSAHLQTALYAERDIASLLKGYVAQEEERLKNIKKLAEDYDNHATLALNNIDKYLGNPVNAFLLIKRFTLDWDRDVLPVISNSTWNTMFQEMEQVRTDLPSYEDLKGAASALMRLQDTYQLDTTSVAHGDLWGVKSPSLSAEECFELGRLSYNNEDFYHTMLWMEQAMMEKEKERKEEKNHEEEEGEETDGEAVDWEQWKRLKREGGKAEMLDFLAFSYYMLGDVNQALTLTNELLQMAPEHERAANNKKYFEAMIRDQASKPSHESKVPGYQANRDEYRNSQEFLTYEALCRGEQPYPVKDAHKLTCRYWDNGRHPELLLQPVKEETMHLDPWLVVYHDVVSDEEIKQVKQIATPKLNRATVQNAKTGALETATYRISKSAWLRGEDYPVVEKLNQRMQAITGLEMATAEELQIANYGLGGHYEPHFDFARKEEKDAFKSLGTGNRVATFLNYMSDVEAGGATVFPYLGLRLMPKKGSAAFWYNLYRNGDGIYNTRHAACPVLVGTKWVANKWVHERGQEFRRPCSLDQDV